MEQLKKKFQNSRLQESKLLNYRALDTKQKKLQDLIMKINQVKSNLICPNYGYNLPCANQLLRDYCQHNHIPAIRKAQQIQTDAISANQQIEDKAITTALKCDENFDKNAEMWIKYPAEPSEKQQEFVWKLLENPRMLKIQMEIAEVEEK